jgi:hypothetical protein
VVVDVEERVVSLLSCFLDFTTGFLALRAGLVSASDVDLPLLNDSDVRLLDDVYSDAEIIFFLDVQC